MREWLIRRLGGYTEQYDDYDDDWDDDETYAPTTLNRLLDKFRHPKAVVTNERIIDMADHIETLDVDTSAFSTMLMRIATPGAVAYWLEDQLMPRLAGDPDNWGFSEWVDA